MALSFYLTPFLHSTALIAPQTAPIFRRMKPDNSLFWRIENARPSTRKAIRLLGVLFVSMWVLNGIALGMTASAPLGILTHPPGWVVALAHAASLMLAVFAGYIFTYIFTPRSRVFVAGTALSMGALVYALTLSTLAWAMPVYTTALASTPTTIEAQVAGTSERRRASLGCHSHLFFGTRRKPGGRICMDGVTGYASTGSTLRLVGDRGPWATRITGFSRP